MHLKGTCALKHSSTWALEALNLADYIIFTLIYFGTTECNSNFIKSTFELVLDKVTDSLEKCRET